MKTLPLILALCLSGLAACSGPHQFPDVASPGANPPPQDAPLVVTGRTDLASCGGDKMAGLIGGPASALPAHGGWSALRVLAPGMMMTLDYSDTRLNVRTDVAGVILDMSCG